MCGSIANNRGTLCRVMGDGVMAVFGAPMASEIHALEACGAAIEMQQAIRDYSEELVADHGSGIEIRVGLHSGEIVVIAGGDPDRNDYDVEGPTVPIAARMEQSANPGEIYLTSATYLLTGDRAEAEEIDPISVKGISNPIQVYVLQQIRPEQETIITSQRSRFVGRRTELSQFRGILNSCISDGQGQTVYVRGEPGIGKTRLVEELSKISIDSGLSVFRGLVLPFGVGKGQDAIRAIVRNLLNLTSGSKTEERQQAALKAQAEGSIEPNQVVFLNDLLDLDQPAEQRAIYDAMNNEVRNEGKQTTVSTLLANICASRSGLWN